MPPKSKPPTASTKESPAPSSPFASLAGLRDQLPPGEEPAAKPVPTSAAPKGPARAVVRYERKGRGGKEATVIEQLGLAPAALDAWCRELERDLPGGASRRVTESAKPPFLEARGSYSRRHR